jgi:hypothetical protein
MSANRFASLAYDDDDDEISRLLPVKPEPIIHIPTTPPFPDLPPSIQKPLAKVSIKNLKPRVSRSYSFYEIANPIQPNIYAIVDDTAEPPDAPPPSPLHSPDTSMNTLADRLRSTLQKEEAQKTNRHFDEARTFEMSTVITGQRFRRVTPLKNFRVLEAETKTAETT